MRAELPPLHLLTDDAVCARAGFLERAAAVLDAGPLVFHLRAPRATGRWLFEAAQRLGPAARARSCLLVVNDRLDVALAAADGVQLGERSLSAADARRTAPAGFRVGVSVHSADAPLEDADWLIAGNVFATPSHPGRPGAGTGLVAALARRGASVVAVGGVTPERVGELRRAGARGVAAIRGIWDAPDPAAAARRYLQAWYA